MPVLRENSRGRGWRYVSRGDLEDRFSKALEMLRRVASGRIHWERQEIVQVLEDVTAPECYRKRGNTHEIA